MFAKWGSVTDSCYLPAHTDSKNKEHQEGAYADAVVLSSKKYGVFFGNKRKEQYKRKENAFKGEEVIRQVIEREQDQQKCCSENRAHESLNFRTIKKAQQLFEERFQSIGICQNLAEIYAATTKNFSTKIPTQTTMKIRSLSL